MSDYNNYKFHSSTLDSIIPRRGDKIIGYDKLVEIYTKNKYGYEVKPESKQTRRGNRQENESIALYRQVSQEFATKNEKQRQTYNTIGTLDLYQPEKKKITDIKTAWNLINFIKAGQKDMEKAYKYQLIDYMRQVLDNELSDQSQKDPEYYKQMTIQIAYCLPDWDAEAVIDELKLWGDYREKVYAFFEYVEDWDFSDFEETDPLDMKITETIKMNCYSKYMKPQERVRLFQFDVDYVKECALIDNITAQGREILNNIKL